MIWFFEIKKIVNLELYNHFKQLHSIKVLPISYDTFQEDFSFNIFQISLNYPHFFAHYKLSMYEVLNIKSSICSSILGDMKIHVNPSDIFHDDFCYKIWNHHNLFEHIDNIKFTPSLRKVSTMAHFTFTISVFSYSFRIISPWY